MTNLYIERYAWPGPAIKEQPKIGTNIIIVIPCFNEPSILKALNSIYSCTSPDCNVEVLVVINHGEKEDEGIKNQNQASNIAIKKWIKDQNKNAVSTLVVEAYDLPGKHAGVGLARKIGMDEAVRRFEYLNNKKGIIVCFDADCQCSSNYLIEIQNTYHKLPETNAALLHFEHPLEGELSDEVYNGITNYELRLRYYKNALKIARFPYSFHTIGSCITVTSETYQKQGGMNKRKAGEDFYFLQKIFPHGGIQNINNATVIPSPRPSDRVPFGTGKAINEILNSVSDEYFSYNIKIFIDLKLMIKSIPIFYRQTDPKSVLENLPLSVQTFLKKIDFRNNLYKIKKNSGSELQFFKSFFQWFNGFAVLKYVHFARDNFYENIEILDGVNWVLSELTDKRHFVNEKRKALMLIRKLDKSDQ